MKNKNPIAVIAIVAIAIATLVAITVAHFRIPKPIRENIIITGAAVPGVNGLFIWHDRAHRYTNQSGFSMVTEPETEVFDPNGKLVYAPRTHDTNVIYVSIGGVTEVFKATGDRYRYTNDAGYSVTLTNGPQLWNPQGELIRTNRQTMQ